MDGWRDDAQHQPHTPPHTINHTQAVGPSEVLHTLLRNLRVQERQNRVCTTVAIAIVAGACLAWGHACFLFFLHFWMDG